MSEDHIDFDEFDRIVEGGWQKPVAPPTMQMRPSGLPHASTYQQEAQPASPPPETEKRHGQ